MFDCSRIEEAAEIQSKFKRFGFNAFSASLEQCLPFKFTSSSESPTSNDDVADKTEQKIHHGNKLSAAMFNRSMLADLSNVFDQLSEYDVIIGCLEKQGDVSLPNYER